MGLAYLLVHINLAGVRIGLASILLGLLLFGLGNSWQLKVILLQLYNTLLDDRSSCATISFGLAFIGAYLVLEQEKVLIFHNMWAYSNM